MNTYRTHTILCLAILAAALLATNWYRLSNAAFFSTNQPSVERVHGPHLVLAPQEYDLGIVKQSGGLVSRAFDVFNNGSESVLINDILTSCSCTSATITTKTIKPGEHGTLTMTFDPNYHFEDEGKFFRTATIKSNIHEKTPEVKLYIEVDYDLGKDKLKFPGTSE